MREIVWLHEFHHPIAAYFPYFCHCLFTLTRQKFISVQIRIPKCKFRTYYFDCSVKAIGIYRISGAIDHSNGIN